MGKVYCKNCEYSSSINDKIDLVCLHTNNDNHCNYYKGKEVVCPDRYGAIVNTEEIKFLDEFSVKIDNREEIYIKKSFIRDVLIGFDLDENGKGAGAIIWESLNKKI